MPIPSPIFATGPVHRAKAVLNRVRSGRFRSFNFLTGVARVTAPIVRYMYYLVTTDHLEDALWFREEDDFVMGMNHVAVQAAANPGVKVLSFILMSNHVHFVLRASEQDALSFVETFKKRYSTAFSRKYGIRALLRRNGTDVKPIPADEPESLERAIAYVQMNCVAAGICAHPYQYPWGTGNAFFKFGGSFPGSDRAEVRKIHTIGSMTKRARKYAFHSISDCIPADWYICDDKGYILPESYVAVNEVQNIFRTPKRLEYFLNSSSKARKRLEIKEEMLPSFKDQSIIGVLPDLCHSLFQKSSFKELTPEQQTELMRHIRYRFSANVNQIARVCGLSYADAAARLDTI